MVKMKRIRAINDHVVVEELIKMEDKTEAGIIIPQTVKIEPQKYGKVLSIGEEVKNLVVGSIVVFHPSGGQAVIIEGQIQRVLKNNEIYGELT
jgi:co-chaperonin GroES (HSP10)